MDAHLQALNKISRTLFKRAYFASGSSLNPIFSPWRKPNQMKHIKACLEISDTTALINYLKTAKSSNLFICNEIMWSPVIENENAPSPFLTDAPDNILKSCDAPVMDTMFSFTSQVHIVICQISTNFCRFTTVFCLM